MQLRPYQADVSDAIDTAWAAGHQNVCAVMPTGAGKTVLFGSKVAAERGISFVIAHRQELISQMSMALARYGVPHSIQAPTKVIRWIVTQHTRELGRHFYNPDARVLVCGVRSLRNRADSLQSYIDRASLWVIDECQHVTGSPANEWGKAVELFPGTCKGLGVTATPERADGRGIGRDASGVMDVMVEGPNMRQLIGAGYLSDYRIFGPYTAIDMSAVTVGSTGDFSKPKLSVAVAKSRIVGDVVENYLKIAPGKLGVTFVPDVKTGEQLTRAYQGTGVPAAMVHAKTPDKIRQECTGALVRGDLRQLVNVDIFGEGYDLPALEVVSFARPTQSYGLYVQQFGRGLRTMEGKDRAIIIDHVGNVKRHGLPDRARVWSMDDREKRSSGPSDTIPVRTCRECLAVYESYLHDCPFCGWAYAPDNRSSVEQVEGDLHELDADVLAEMRGELDRINAPEGSVGDKLRHAGAPGVAVAGAMKNHRVRQEVQADLRGAMAEWGGYQRAAGQNDKEIMVRFYNTFGVDILTAQTLGRVDAGKLMDNIQERIK